MTPEKRVMRPSSSMNCAVCDKSFRVYACENGRKKFCSKKCLGMANGIRQNVYDVRVLVKAISTDDCVEWPGSRNWRGYGKATLDGRPMNAQRAAYISTHGDIDASLVVRHKCDNPPCFNPRHLCVGTAKDNSADMVSRGRGLLGTRNHACKLTEEDVLAIRQDKRPSRKVAADYGVDKTTILSIRRRLIWGHI